MRVQGFRSSAQSACGQFIGGEAPFVNGADQPRGPELGFLRFNTTPAPLDWFDDHTAVLTNAWLAARLARVGRCPGLLFDLEQYNAPLFDYRNQRNAKTKSWEVYAAQVRQRGREIG